jgi:hypothetical protein
MIPSTMRESEVVVQLMAANPEIPDESLEEHMFAVLEAVEQHAADIALGPVVAVDFDAHAIELAFCVCHRTQADAQQKIADVMAVVEQHTPVKFGSSNATVNEPNQADSRPVALAP